MVSDGLGPLVKRCHGFDGSSWSRLQLLHSCFVFQGAAQLTRGNDYVSEQGNIDGGKAAESGRCR